MSCRESEHSTLAVAWFVSELRRYKCVRESAALGLGGAVTPALVGLYMVEVKSRLQF